MGAAARRVVGAAARRARRRRARRRARRALDGDLGDAGPVDAQPDAPPPEPQDSGPPLPGEVDAAAAEPVAIDRDTSTDTLRRQIAALSPLAEGKPPAEGVEIATLFQVDLRDDAGVHARMAELRAAIDAARAEVDPLVARKTAAEQGRAAQPTLEEAARLERLGLLVEREGLRLAVLTRPLAERIALLEAEAARRRAATEQASAAAMRVEAEEAVRRAELAREEALREVESARAARRRGRSRRRGRRRSGCAASSARALRGTAAEQRAARAEAAQRRTDLIHRVRTTLAEPQTSAATVDALHDTIVPELMTARADLAAALDVVDEPVAAPALEAPVDLDAAVYRALPLERDAVLRAFEAAGKERATYVAEVEADRRAAVPATAEQVKTLNDLRLALLPRLSPTRREAVLGLGTQGIEQLRRELGHLRLMARYYVFQRRAKMRQASGWLVETLGRASTRWTLIELLLLALLAVPLALRRRRILDWIDARIQGWAEDDHPRAQVRWDRAVAADRRQLVERWWPPIKALAFPLAFYAFVQLAFGLLVELIDAPETRLIARVAEVMATYWLVIALVHYVLVRIASRPGAPIDEQFSARLLRTVRLAGRTAAVLSVFLIVAEVVLGRGYLYTLVLDFAWFAAVPIGWVTIRRWQPDIFAAYLRMAPGGSMASLVERARGKLWGAFVAVPVALYLGVRRSGQIVGRWVMRLEHVRRALAFLFLRRLEKQATADRATAAPDRPPPAEVVAIIEQKPIDDAVRVEHFPGLAAAVVDIAAWRAGAIGISWAVVGERGIGRTAWLDTFVARIGEGAAVLRIDRPVPTAEALCRWLVDALGLGEAPATVDGIVAALEGGSARLVILDDVQFSAQRAAGRQAGFEALLQIVRRSHRTAWVCSVSRYLWAWLMFARKGQDVFRHTAVLDRWSERDVAGLIDRRMAAAGRSVTFEDLMDNPDQVFEREEELLRTRERYLRLLWDYAEGIPDLVLHFWARSLVDPGDGGPLRVRLFEVPKPDELEDLSDPARFALHAVVMHTRLSLDDAPTVLQLAPAAAHAMLEQLRALGCLVAEGSSYRIPIHWHRAVVRFLRRKHLLLS
ncbi:MAG: hypothetical protein H6705_15765 [Myxococcales bacterium]|nr:hypothetical protein [Myxococcales bacterium]